MINTERDPAAVFFWARLGGGHKTAKDAIQERLTREYAAKGQNLDTSADYDMTGDKILNAIWLPFIGRLGDKGADSWNNAQKAGNLSTLTRIASLGWIGELLLYPFIYFKVKHLFMQMKQEPRHIISTQAFCLNAIARAVLAVNKEKGWNMHIDVHLTDLPSKMATHFFPSVRRATNDAKLQKLITLHAPHPLVKSGSSEADFWRKHCGKAHVVSSDVYPIRRAFLETKSLGEKLSKSETTISMKLNHENESKILDCGKEDTEAKTYEITVKKEDKVGFLMLGSQPTTESVRAWLHTFVEESRKQTQKKDREYYFFLFCGAPEKANAQNPLLESVRKEIECMQKQHTLPANVHIVPFTNQNADFIAHLMARSDLTITRSGGATSMELLQLRQSKDIPKRPDQCTFIHSEALSRPKDQESYAALETTLHSLVEAIHTTKGTKVRLSPEEWIFVAKELEKTCRKMGISKKEAAALSQSIIECYKKGHAPSQTIVRNILSAFQNRTESMSSQSIARTRKIEKKVNELRKKEKYASLPEKQLRQQATEALLRDEGIILWEGKNAKYLQEKLGAEVVNPEFAQQSLREKFFGRSSN